MIRAVLKIGIVFVLSLVLLYEGVKTLYIIKPIAPVVYSKKDTTLYIKGMIYNKTYGPPNRPFVHMPDLTQQLVKLVRGGNTEISLSIDSGGGLMREGMEFVHTMREARLMGVKFTCVVEGRAMSMALIIFSECDNRYAVFGSKIMWHSIAQNRSFVRLNEQNTSQILEFFKAKNEQVWAPTRIHFLPWYFTEHFTKETILSASEVERNSIRYLRVIRKHIVN